MPPRRLPGRGRQQPPPHRAESFTQGLQTTDDFIRCLENAFRHFGGVPRTRVPDNLKAAVIRADGFDPDLNPKIQAFAAHYGTAILPTKPRTPRHKEKIERGVDYVQENCLKGHTFTRLETQNCHLLDGETTVADTLRDRTNIAVSLRHLPGLARHREHRRQIVAA